MNADPKGVARALHAAADLLARHTDRMSDTMEEALEAIRLVASTLENVIEPDGSLSDRLSRAEQRLRECDTMGTFERMLDSSFPDGNPASPPTGDAP